MEEKDIKITEPKEELQNLAPKKDQKKWLIIFSSFLAGLLLLLFLIFLIYSQNKKSELPEPPPRRALNFRENRPRVPVIAISSTPSTPPTITPTSTPDTLSSPIKIPTSDGKSYFIYGAPQGQNAKEKKKIIFSLPGHGTLAENDYDAWKTQLLANGNYALASINWWDGAGETTSNYFSPEKILSEMKYFMSKNDYNTKDYIILFGFSRGSANTYSVAANDAFLGNKIIDGIISASGKYQSDFAMTDKLLNYNNGKPYQGYYWILACGEKDPNPSRDGCIGMKETETFLTQKGASILSFLEDPNGAHGAFHKSPLNLAKKALDLFDTVFK